MPAACCGLAAGDSPGFGGVRDAGSRLSLVLALFSGTVLAAASPAAVAAQPPAATGLAAVADLALPTATGVRCALGEDAAAAYRVVCFVGSECPLARLYGPRLDALAQEFAAQGVRFYGVNSNLQDSLADVAQYAADYGVSFPVLKDHERRVAVALGATRTPEAFVFDAAGQVVYHGRIDDQYEPGVARPAPTVHYLRAALEQLLAGRPVEIAQTEPVGCLMTLPDRVPEAPPVEGPAVTFTNQVSRILQRHCVECHRSGEIGPFALEEYGEVVGWGEMMLEVIDQGRMPPWHADSQHGQFANARHIPPADVETLRRWVASGMPFGDESELPPPLERVGEWDLPQPPDLVLDMSPEPFRTPPQGTVEYQYYVVDPQFAEDKWVKAVQVAPGNRSVVHHAIAFLRPPDGGDVRAFGLLGAYVPGQRGLQLPEGYAQRIPAGSRLVFQMHYTPTGRSEDDVTRIGLVFADPDQVTHEVYTVGGVEQEFEIPPHAADYAVAGQMRGVPRDGVLLSVAPHMHLRGKAFRLMAQRAEGEEVLLDVPQYDFNWQHNYALVEPLPLADVEELRFVATFDNSANNPFNPDPAEYVTWGDQTWQEMAVAFATVARPLTEPAADSAAEAEPTDQAARAEAAQRRAEEYADQYLQRLDANGDGVLERLEVPDSVRMFAFRQLDLDGDGFVTRDEIVRRAADRFARSR